jgi:hypothetical protein
VLCFEIAPCGEILLLASCEQLSLQSGGWQPTPHGDFETKLGRSLLLRSDDADFLNVKEFLCIYCSMLPLMAALFFSD